VSAHYSDTPFFRYSIDLTVHCSAPTPKCSDTNTLLKCIISYRITGSWTMECQNIGGSEQWSIETNRVKEVIHIHVSCWFCMSIILETCRNLSLWNFFLFPLLVRPKTFLKVVWEIIIQMILLKAIWRRCLYMCNENETSLLRKNFFLRVIVSVILIFSHKIYRTIKTVLTITFVKITEGISYNNCQ